MLNTTLRAVAVKMLLAMAVFCASLAGAQTRTVMAGGDVYPDYHVLKMSWTTSAPNTGAVSVTIPNYGTLANIPWNSTAATVQTLIDGISPANKPIAVAFGGPWPFIPITIRIITPDRFEVSRFTFSDSTVPDVNFIDISRGFEAKTGSFGPLVRYGRENENFTTPPDKTIGFGTFTNSNLFTFDNDSAVSQAGNDATAATIIQKKFPTPINLLGYEYFMLEFYNPMQFAQFGTISISDAWNFTQLGSVKDFWQVMIPSGWSTILLDSSDLKSHRSFFNWSKVAGVEVRIESYNNTTGTTNNGTLATGLYTDGMYVTPRAKAKVVLTYDDGFKAMWTKAWPIMQQYPSLKHSLFVVKNWIELGYRDGVDISQTATLQQLQTMHASGLVEIGNHSDRHHKYESGPNLDNPAPVATEQAIQWKPGANPPAFTLTIPGYGTTVPIAKNATQWVVKAALQDIVGSLVEDVQGSYLSTTLGINGALRVSFTEDLPIMIPDTPLIQTGPAHSTTDIALAYQNNADYLVQNGLGGAENIVAYPEGNCGIRVFSALRLIGMRSGRYYSFIAANPYTWTNSIKSYQQYQMPAYNFGGNLSTCLAYIERAIRTGAVIHIMFHDMWDNPGAPGKANTEEYRSLLKYLEMRNGKELEVVGIKELADQMGL